MVLGALRTTVLRPAVRGALPFLVLIAACAGADDAGEDPTDAADDAIDDHAAGDVRTSLIGDLIHLPPGTFQMGSPEDELGRSPDEVLHEVHLTRGFWAARTELTRERYEALVGQPPFTRDCPDCPVGALSWFDALLTANVISEADGLEPCYVVDGCAVDEVGMHCEEARSVHPDPVDCEGYRLPTEAEWEYLARSGGTSSDPFPSGGGLLVEHDAEFCEGDVLLDDGHMLSEQAWFCGHRYEAALGAPVAQLAPTPLGFYDVAGNVWEWVWGSYVDYPHEAVIDPMTAPFGDSRMIRGGAIEVPKAQRAAQRVRFAAWTRDEQMGVRLVVTGP